MERILVTGGAGYIGSVLVGYLLKRKYRVTVVDNLLYGQTSLFHHCGNDSFDFVRGDVRDERIMAELVRASDAIIHLAAIVGMKACEKDPLMAQSVNLDAAVLLNRLRGKSQKVIYPCTNSGYGTKSGSIYCTEETPLEPISLYGTTKVKAESELLSKENTVSLRLATVFGPSPRMRIDLLVNDFVHRAVTDGSLVIYEKDFKRNYIHIDDVGECFVFCLGHFDEMKGGPYNVGLNEANLSKAELAEEIKKHVPGLYIHYAEIGQDPDRRNYIVSNEKIYSKGFSARRSIEKGIKQLIKLYQMFPKGDFSNA